MTVNVFQYQLTAEKYGSILKKYKHFEEKWRQTQTPRVFWFFVRLAQLDIFLQIIVQNHISHECIRSCENNAFIIIESVILM